MSVFLNDDDDGDHTLVVRSPGDDAGARSGSYHVGAAVSGVVALLRRELDRRPPSARPESRKDLIAHLRRVAPLASRLWQTVGPALADFVPDLASHPGAVISITRPHTSTFTLPWSLVYDIHIESDLQDDPGRIPVCGLVEEWSGGQLVDPALRDCPRADEHPDDGVLCPFGFWGFRYALEVQPHRKPPASALRVDADGRLLALLTEQVSDKPALEAHIDAIRTVTRMSATTTRDKRTARSELQSASSLVYFYCHGAKGKDAVELAIGRGDRIPPTDVSGWVTSWMKKHRRPAPWSEVPPLVFINACHSLAIDADTAISYVDVFVGAGKAAGVVGTEVRVDQAQARDFALAFFERVYAPGGDRPTVAAALQDLRHEWLADGSIFGLLYTAHAFADLRVERVP